MRKEAIKILENISITAGIPTPTLYILEKEKGLNAFAVGTNKKNCAVILTKGLVETLDKSELEAVIAHEVAHIIHKDTTLMMIVTLLIGFFTYLGYIMVRSLGGGGGRSSKRSSGSGKGGAILLLIGLAFLLYGYVIAPLLRLAVSRTREFHADAKSALLTRNPQALISALKKIAKHPIVDTLNSEVNNNELVAPMCIENPLRIKVSLFDSLSNLSSTHPPIDKRIQALEVMDGRSLDF
jgi:heat shock protein HtpX